MISIPLKQFNAMNKIIKVLEECLTENQYKLLLIDLMSFIIFNSNGES